MILVQIFRTPILKMNFLFKDFAKRAKIIKVFFVFIKMCWRECFFLKYQKQSLYFTKNMANCLAKIKIVIAKGA